MGMWIFKTLGVSLFLTLVLELFFVWRVGKASKRDLLLAFLVNVLTNPFVVSMYYITFFYTNWNQTLVICVLEVSAVLVEWICYKKCGEKITYPFLLSAGANGFSYFLGGVIDRLI